MYLAHQNRASEASKACVMGEALRGAGADAWPIVELDHVEQGED